MKKTTAGIKSRGIRFGFVLAGMMVAAGAQAGEFVFSAKTEVLNDASGSSVLINGTHVLAGNARGVPSLIINGVDFVKLEIDDSIAGGGVVLSLSGTLMNPGIKDAAVAYYTENANLGTLLRSSYESSSYGAGNLILDLTGLTIGQAYQLQGFYWDDVKTFNVRDPNYTTNSAVYFPYDTTPGSGEFAMGNYWTATWTADATSKSIEIYPGSRATIAGVSLRTFVPVDPYEEWISQFPSAGSETNLVDNPDGDSLDNLYEWALGGDPTNSADIGHVPAFGVTEDGGTNWFEYIYAKRNDATSLGLTYDLEQCTDLTSGVWTNNGNYDVVTGVLDGEFDTVTNRADTAAEDEQFFRLNIERN